MKKALIFLLLLSFSGCMFFSPKTHRELSDEECQSIVDNAESFVMGINQEETYGFVVLERRNNGIYAIRSNEGEWKRLRIGESELDLSTACESEKAKAKKRAEAALQDIQECYQKKLFEMPHNNPMGSQELTLYMDLTQDGLVLFSDLGYWTSGYMTLSLQTTEKPVTIEVYLTDAAGDISSYEFGAVWVRRG